MASLSIAEANNHLSELIDRELSGDRVVIMCHGRPVIELEPAEPGPRPLTMADLDWLAALRGQGPVPEEDAATTVRRLRDDRTR
jgi:prevent-host-death family protein